MSVKLPESPCPHCGHVVDAASSPDDLPRDPEPGDASVCINCGGVNVFTETFHLRAAKKEDMAKFPPEAIAMMVMVKGAVERMLEEKDADKWPACPTCGGHVKGPRFYPTSKGLCDECSSVVVVNHDGTLRMISDAEWDDLSDIVKGMIREIRARRRQKKEAAG